MPYEKDDLLALAAVVSKALKDGTISEEAATMMLESLAAKFVERCFDKVFNETLQRALSMTSGYDARKGYE